MWAPPAGKIHNYNKYLNTQKERNCTKYALQQIFKFTRKLRNIHQININLTEKLKKIRRNIHCNKFSKFTRRLRNVNFVDRFPIYCTDKILRTKQNH